MMTATARYPVFLRPSKRTLMDRALGPYILLGMPHLTPWGLSETWLMKELGHRHWMMLARQMGMEDADFRTVNGEEAYAAITATSLCNARFDIVGANDVIEIGSTMQAVSATQILTRHDVCSEKGLICEVSLLSAFVHRTRRGDNYSIARVQPAMSVGENNCLASELAAKASAVRSGNYDKFQLPNTSTRALPKFHYRPSLSQEFNGAKLLYFCQFQSLMDRALEAYGDDRTIGRHNKREIVFLGNLGMGEELTIETDMADGSIAAISRIRRMDGSLMALASTCWDHHKPTSTTALSTLRTSPRSFESTK